MALCLRILSKRTHTVTSVHRAEEKPDDTEQYKSCEQGSKKRDPEAADEEEKVEALRKANVRAPSLPFFLPSLTNVLAQFMFRACVGRS